MADSEAQPNHATDNPSKYYYNHLLFKALIVTVFLVVLPLFSSQPPPDSINQTLHTRSWEILQLIFVGIAVSYGLFSRKSEEIDDKENGCATKFDNAQSYVSRLLQFSSVFDDESEDGSVLDDDHNSSSDNKVIQTWNNQYRRGEAVVVVAKERHGDEEQTSMGSSVSVKTSKVGEKPLLLPVRSLKSRVAEGDDLAEEANSKRFWSKSMKGEENLVLPSPIPWRSRSGRMEMKEESKLFSSTSSSSMAEDPEFNKLEPRSFRSQSFSRPNSTSPSPNKHSPSPSPSSESSQQLRILEEMAVRKKTTTPAPPPPPPHYFLGKSSSMKSIPSALAAKKKEDEKELRRSVRSVPAEIPIPEEVKGEEAAVQNHAGKSAFTPFNGRGRSYGIAKAKESFVKKEGEGEAESDESEMEDEDDFFDENGAGGENGSEYNSSGDGGPPDVDKKADEFIAKFREQIRLQRIESIRRSAGQTAAARNQLVR
ncbi:MAP7 domain-containing protein 1-like [Ipomoea triloba]|uniref:MAP7 domain-containing protein 1-like n=1 Tax=Ipomoea triloba TaxID=35885 RepID=UPI00125CDF9C|nr:MAP7 domain-containing protein 1-like [Ipomoea triloba]